jgi:hypothetical protein
MLADMDTLQDVAFRPTCHNTGNVVAPEILSGR